MGMLTIERLGGLAGFGGANLKSEGQLDFADLSSADQATIERLFEGAGKARPGNTADAFRYRITRLKNGRRQSIEAPESGVPQSLIASVKDTLR